MEERYKEVSLNKFKLLLLSNDLEFIQQTSEDHKVYGYESKNIGWFYDLEEAKEALKKYSETEPEIIGYEIIGPEYGFGKEEYFPKEEEGMEEETWENEESDESPEYHLIFDSQKKLISSYYYDKENPGGTVSENEKVFHKGDIAYLRDTIFVLEKQYNLLIPVEIEGKVTKEYLENKWRNAIKEGDKKTQGKNAVEEPSEERVQSKIDSLLNIEKDSFIFKPLVTVKCNWGEEPNTPFDDARRIDYFPHINNIINYQFQKWINKI